MKGVVSKMCNINGQLRKEVTIEDFLEVFKVFSEYPFNEFWTKEEIKEQYYEIINNGTVFGYYVGDKCVAVITLVKYAHIKSMHPVHFPEDANVIYLSDLATKKEYRKKGIGTCLFQCALEYAYNYGYDHIYLRTNAENSMSYGIAKKFGFTQIPNITQDVKFLRTDGIVKSDSRIFMEKKIG